MNFHSLFVSSVSACFELESTSAYFAEEPYDVWVNGAPALTGVRTNVFSLFELEPGREYRVSIGGESRTVTTLSESACVRVRDFGAVGDGVTDDTLAIQSAISACPAHGRVRIDPGVYQIRPLTLKSHMTLELAEGATLLGDTAENHYPLLPGTLNGGDQELVISTWEGAPMAGRQSLITAFWAEDITITGRGVVDGNAQNGTWWENVKQRTIGRPRLMFFNHCRQVTFHGILGKNSASWHFHPFFCQDVGFYDMAVEAPKDSPNTDGTNPESCDDVRFVGVRYSVGDDAIAIKSGKIYMGMKYRTPATRHLIRNCLMEYAHGAIVLGSEMSGGIRDLDVSQCLFSHTDRGLRIKTRRGRGKYAVIDGVTFSNIRMDNVMTPLVMNMYYFCDPDGHEKIVWDKAPHPVDDTTPYLGSFHFRDMVCTDCEWAAGYFYGLTEQPIGSVTIENVRFSFKENASSGRPAMMDHIENECRRGLYFNCVNQVTLKNVTMTGQLGQQVTAIQVREVREE